MGLVVIGIIVGAIGNSLGWFSLDSSKIAYADGLRFQLTRGGSFLEVSVDSRRGSDTGDPTAVVTIAFPKPDKYWTIRRDDGSEWTLDGSEITGMARSKPPPAGFDDIVYIDPDMIVSFPVRRHIDGYLHIDETRIVTKPEVLQVLAEEHTPFWKSKVDLPR